MCARAGMYICLCVHKSLAFSVCLDRQNHRSDPVGLSIFFFFFQINHVWEGEDKNTNKQTNKQQQQQKNLTQPTRKKKYHFPYIFNNNNKKVMLREKSKLQIQWRTAISSTTIWQRDED